MDMTDNNTLLKHLIQCYGVWCYRYHSALDRPSKTDYNDLEIDICREQMEGSFKYLMDFVNSEYQRKIK